MRPTTATTDSAPPPASPRRTCWRALALAWLANVALGSLIGHAYVGEALAGASTQAHVYVVAGIVSSLATVLLVPALLMSLAVLAFPNVRAIGGVQAIVWSLFQILIFADTRVYALFRYHFNGMVWNLVTTPGGQDTIDLGPGAWALLAVSFVVLTVVQYTVWMRVFARDSYGGAALAKLRHAPLLRWGMLVVLGFVLCEKTIYAAADLRRDREITSLSRLFPLYQRMTINRFVQNVLKVRLDERASVEVGTHGGLLRYPIAPPTFAPRANRPNVLMLVIDSLRADMLEPEAMPEVSRFAATSGRRYSNHASGGNATRYGVFTLLYGLDGSYWQPVYDEKAPPVFITSLQSLGYDMRVYSSASLSFPEFRSTAFVTMEDKVEDKLGPTEKHARDTMIATRFESWMTDRDARAANEPFFAFALLDSSHQSYDWPRDATRFRPFAERIDYYKMSSRPSDADLAAVKNSYKNAVAHADHVVGQMLATLAAHGQLANTLIVITGDHGEEFFENGYFGHTSNFTREQAHVTFVMAGPGIEAGVEDRPTSHVDVVPTLLELLGADPAQRADWCQGESLLAPPATRERAIAGWQEAAIWVDGGILHVPLEGHKGFVEAYDYAWKPIDREREFISLHSAAVARFALACRRFLR